VCITIDTNIWMAGLLWRGMPWRLLRLAEARKVGLCAAPSMVVELAQVLCCERVQGRLEQLGPTPAELVTYVLNLGIYL